MRTRPPSHLPIATKDCLDHTKFAADLVKRIDRLADGSAVTLRGSWGSGKTDVLGRVQRCVSALAGGSETRFADSLSINPWRYAQADLLTPLVRQLLLRMKEDASKWEKAKEVGRKALILGYPAAIRSVLGFIPGGKLVETAKEAFETTLEALTSGDSTPAADSTEEAGQRFAELTQMTLDTVAPGRPEARILVCVDDLDRCEPERQIAMLEAIHFLVAAQARVVVLCAVDPHILRNAVRAKYRVPEIDADAFLDKIFVFSQELHPGPRHLLLKHLLEQPIAGLAKPESLSEWAVRIDADGLSTLMELVGSSMPASLTVPRVIERAVHRLGEAVIAGLGGPELQLPSSLSDHNVRSRVAFWIAATTRWPSIRGDVRRTQDEFHQDRMSRPKNYTDSPESLALAWPVPGPIQRFIERWPDTEQFFFKQRDTPHAGWTHVSHHYEKVLDTFATMDERFQKLGL